MHRGTAYPAEIRERVVELCEVRRSHTWEQAAELFGVGVATVNRWIALRKTERTTTRKEDASWAALMKHSFGLDILGCPRPSCKGRLTLVAVIFDRDEVKRLLEHLRLFTEPIPMKSARDPPELWTEAYDFD